MFKKRSVVKLLVAVALMFAITGGSGIVGDTLGFEFVSEVYACSSNSGSGGEC